MTHYNIILKAIQSAFRVKHKSTDIKKRNLKIIPWRQFNNGPMLSASLAACPASTISWSQCEIPQHRSAQLQICSGWSCRMASIFQWPRLEHSVQQQSPGRHSEHQADQMTHILDCHLPLEYLCISNCPCSLLAKRQVKLQ